MIDQESIASYFENRVFPVIWEDWFLDILCEGGEWKFVEYKENKELLGLWLYWQKKKLGLTYITMPPAVKYMGPVFKPDLSQAQKEKAYDYMSLMLPSSSYYVQQFLPELDSLKSVISTDKTVERTTFIWDLSPTMDELHQALDGNYRRAIRKYEESGGKLDDENLKQKSTKAEIDALIEMLVSSMGPLEEHGISEMQLTKLIKAAESRSKGKLLVCRNHVEIIGASFIVWDKKRAYYLFAGNHKDHRKLYPGVLTVWKTALFLKVHTTVKDLDLYGSSIETIARVWKKIGAKEQSYLLVENHPNRFFRLLQWGKNKWRGK